MFFNVYPPVHAKVLLLYFWHFFMWQPTSVHLYGICISWRAVNFCSHQF